MVQADQTLLIQAQAALEKGDLKKAQSVVTGLLKSAPTDRDTLMLQSILHISADKPDAALAALDLAQKHHGDDVLLLTSKAAFLLDHFDDADAALPLLEKAVRLLEAERLDGADADPELKVLASEAYLSLSEARAILRDFAASRVAAERAVKLTPRDPAAHLMLGTAFLDEGRADEAIAAAKRALQEDAELGDAHWLVARAAWLQGADKEADAAVAQAVKLDGTRFYKPFRTDRETIIRLLRESLSELPAIAGGPLSKVAVSVEDAPHPAQLHNISATVLGTFEGEARPGPNPLENLPPRVILFRRNLEWMARNRRELKELITGTLMHEVARYSGIELAELDASLS